MITSHWSANPAVILPCAAVLAVHATGLRRMIDEARAAHAVTADGAADSGAAGDPRADDATQTVRSLRREAVIFYLGMLAVAAALLTPIGHWSVKYVWVRAVQDLMLTTAGPPLIVLGAPWRPLRRGLPDRWQRAAGPAAASGAQGAPGARGAPGVPAAHHGARTARPWWLTGSALIGVAFNVVWIGWHLPALYDAALTSRFAYAAEVITYLAAAIAFWLVLIGSAPVSPRLTPLRRVTLVFGTVIADTVLGMVLVFGSGLLYVSFPGSAHHVLSVVADQQVAGAVLWMGMLPPLIIVTVALFVQWLNDEESEELSAGLDRLLGHRKYTWPSGPGLK
jgi:putative membrane protein